MSDVSAPEFWDDAYRLERDGWDMGTPTPVFVELLNSTRGDFTEIGGPDYRQYDPLPRVAMPCSGRGYDAILFSEFGFEVTAIDFSEKALESLHEPAAATPALNVLHADMFAMGVTHAAAFDLLVEYTCVCAIDPARRAELVDVMAAMLVPGGHALLLLFPVDGRPGGPPFAIDVEEWNAMMSLHFDKVYDAVPTTSVKPRRDRERLMLWRKRASEGARQ